MAYIADSSQSVEACYDWIKTIAAHPELFQGMPAHIPQRDNPAFIASQDIDTIRFYREFGQILSTSKVLTFPLFSDITFNSTSSSFEHSFFYQALDNVILHNADLESELSLAEEKIDAFRVCIMDQDVEDPQPIPACAGQINGP